MVQPLEELFLKDKEGVKVIITCTDPSDVRLSEKAASFIRSLAEQGRLQAEDVASLGAALTPLMSAISDKEIQYRETLSSCIGKLAQLAPTACPPELKAA